MFTLKTYTRIAALVATVFCTAPAAWAANPLYDPTRNAEAFLYFQNGTDGIVDIKWFSQDRGSAWCCWWLASGFRSPTDNHPWFIMDAHPGEIICYGAWYRNRPAEPTWGAGRNGEHKADCKNCCFQLPQNLFPTIKIDITPETREPPPTPIEPHTATTCDPVFAGCNTRYAPTGAPVTVPVPAPAVTETNCVLFGKHGHQVPMPNGGWSCKIYD
jgi:hypothetical protein